MGSDDVTVTVNSDTRILSMSYYNDRLRQAMQRPVVAQPLSVHVAPLHLDPFRRSCSKQRDAALVCSRGTTTGMWRGVQGRNTAR